MLAMLANRFAQTPFVPHQFTQGSTRKFLDQRGTKGVWEKVRQQVLVGSRVCLRGLFVVIREVGKCCQPLRPATLLCPPPSRRVVP